MTLGLFPLPKFLNHDNRSIISTIAFIAFIAICCHDFFMKATQAKPRSKAATPLSSDELGLTQRSRGIFASHTDKKGRVTLQITHGRAKESLIIPAAAARLFDDILGQLSKGNMVSVMSEQREISTQQAADLLNVSRPYIVGLLDGGQIPFRKVGTHRRVYTKDVITYKNAIDSQRERTLTKLAKQAQELKMGY